MTLLGRLAMPLHDPRSRKRIMVLIESYMDETGHSDDPEFRFAGMAGFAAPAEE